MESGGIRPDGSRWRESLAVMRAALDGLPAHVDWRLSGGTALSLQLGHRDGRDLDFSLRSIEALDLLSPTTNLVTREFATAWREHGHFTKLWSRSGEVDLVVSRDLTGLPPEERTIDGFKVRLDRPEEIVARKIAHRGRHLRPVDVFDIGKTYEALPAVAPMLAAKILPERLHEARDRVEELASHWGEGAEFSRDGAGLPNAGPMALKCLDQAIAIAADARNPKKRASDELTAGW